MRIAARHPQLSGDHANRDLGIDRLPGPVGLVGNPANQRDVERKNGPFTKQDDGAAGAQSMADAELVEYVRIGAGDVGDGVVAKHEALEHRLVDGAADLFLVRPHRLKAGLRHRRRNDLLVDGIEIGYAPAGIHLAAERHEHEAQGVWLIQIVHGFAFAPPTCVPDASPRYPFAAVIAVE